MRRLFPFLFRHEWAISGEQRYSPTGDVMVRDKCKRCGIVSDWRSLFDQEGFARMYRTRGCRGSNG